MDSFVTVFYKVFSFIGFLLLLAVIGAATYDVLNINKDFEYNNLHLSQHGLVKRGYVLDAHIHCENKFLGLSISGLTFYYKEAGKERITEIKADQHCAKWKQNNISEPMKAPAAPATSETPESTPSDNTTN